MTRYTSKLEIRKCAHCGYVLHRSDHVVYWRDRAWHAECWRFAEEQGEICPVEKVIGK